MNGTYAVLTETVPASDYPHLPRNLPLPLDISPSFLFVGTSLANVRIGDLSEFRQGFVNRFLQIKSGN